MFVDVQVTLIQATTGGRGTRRRASNRTWPTSSPSWSPSTGSSTPSSGEDSRHSMATASFPPLDTSPPTFSVSLSMLFIYLFIHRRFYSFNLFSFISIGSIIMYLELWANNLGINLKLSRITLWRSDKVRCTYLETPQFLLFCMLICLTVCTFVCLLAWLSRRFLLFFCSPACLCRQFFSLLSLRI